VQGAQVQAALCVGARLHRHAAPHAADPKAGRDWHSAWFCQSNLLSAGLCRLLSQVFQEAVMRIANMLRRVLLGAVLGLGLSGCYYYGASYDAYPATYYYPGYYSPYYYGGYYGPRYYGGARYYYYGGHGYRGGYGRGYHGGGYHGGHH
jgi:hypothetical protein